MVHLENWVKFTLEEQLKMHIAGPYLREVDLLGLEEGVANAQVLVYGGLYQGYSC